MSVLDIALNPQQQRWQNASVVKDLLRVRLPHLDVWNYSACEAHKDTGPTPSCEYRKCGGDFFDHQTKSISFLYISAKAIEASVTGAGKTNCALGLLALCKHYGEEIKAIIVCQTPAVAQWAAEAARFAPGLRTVSMPDKVGKSQRLALYASDWEVLIVGHHIMTRDITALTAIGPLQAISDDVDPILNPKNKTARAWKALTLNTERTVEFNATSLQTRLQQLWAASSYIGGERLFGSEKSFEARYVKKEPVWIRINGSLTKQLKTTGYKNLTDFRSKFDPMVIRHSYEDMTDVRLPEAAAPQQIWLDLHPRQREKYTLLQQGVLDLQKKDMPPQQKMVSALTMFTHGAQICSGLPALGEEDGPGASSKLDWLERQLVTDWNEQKVVVFARNVGTVKALHDRLKRHGIGYATVWGQKTEGATKDSEVKKFWDDPNCRVMIGTASMERSLNLQVSNLLVFVDTIPNPARMMQTMGRVRRAGSTHERVYTFYLLTRDTQEERSLKTIAARQAVIDAVNDDNDTGLFDRLTPEELLALISP